MLNVHTVFFSPALLMSAIALSGMLWSFASKAHKNFKDRANDNA